MKLPNRDTGYARGVIAPRLAIVAAVGVCVAALVYLTPSRSELFKRHMNDGDAAAAGLLIRQGEEGDSDEVTKDITHETIRLCEREKWKSSTLDMLISFLRNSRNFAAAADAALDDIDRLPAKPRVEVLSALVDRAIAEGDLPFAQDLQIQLVERSEVLTPAIVRQAVTTYRYNGNPALALITIEELEQQRGSLPNDLRELRVVLARETSQPDVAFILLSKRVRATDDPQKLETLIPQAIQAGIEAGRQDELIPHFEKFLEIAKTGSGSSPALVSEYSMKLAQTYEWTKQPNKAFDLYLELAQQGTRSALDRCFALNPGLLRQGDLTNVLVAAHEHYRDDSDLLLQTARYCAEAGEREDAIRFYGEYLEREPKDADAHFWLGAIYDESQQFEMALHHYILAHELQPKEIVFLKKSSRLAIVLRRYEQALSFLRTLSLETRKRDCVSQYYTLADGLGDLEATKEALRLLIEIGGRLTVTNYVYLAATYREEGNLSEQIAVLEEAAQKFPENIFVRLELAHAYLQIRRPDECLKALETVDLSVYAGGAQVAVDAFTDLGSSRFAHLSSRFLKQFSAQLEGSEDLSSQERLQFGDYCRLHGSSTRAVRLFQRVVKDGAEPGDLALAHFRLRQYRSALPAQLEHIKLTPAPKLTTQDYQLLGEIQSKLGQAGAARKSYQKALELLKKRTATPQN